MTSRKIALLTVVLLLLGSSSARAADYDVFIDIETEEDLLDLKNSGEITDSTYETLKELLDDGVDLNTDDRETLYTLPNLTYAEVDAILKYRKESGRIDDPAALVKAGALSAKKLGAIAPFIKLVRQKVKLFTTSGRFRYGATYAIGDTTVPSMFLSARITTLRNLDVGLTMVMTRDWLGKPVYDPNRTALAADPAHVRFHVPKFFVQYETKKYHVVAGTFRIGFGQRLVFDNTGHYTPNGIRLDDSIYYNQTLSLFCRESAGELADSPCAGDDQRYKYHSPDYKWTDRLRGVAFGLKKIEVGGKAWMQVYGFVSYQTHNIYQYEIYNRGICDDPLDDNNPLCKAPSVYRIQGDRLAQAPTFKYSTLPDMYNELLGGGNVTLFLSRRTYVGITGYGSDVRWLVDGIDLDFQEWSKLPYGGPFGAIGVNAAWGHKWADIFLELGHSFDSMPGKGGFAAILRTVFSFKKQEVELVARYYDKDFANPHARPISDADEYDGLRARDEAGFRAKYTGKLKDVYLRGLADFWVVPYSPSAEVDVITKLRLRARVDYEIATWFRPGLLFEYMDKDLEYSGHDECYEISYEYGPDDEPIPCRGQKIDIGALTRFAPHRTLSFTLFGQLRFVDDATSSGGVERYPDAYRKDVLLWFLAMYKPTKDWRIRARVRYRLEAVDHLDYMEESLWAYLEAAYWYKRLFRVKARVEIMKYLDDRTSSVLRIPSPEVWARLELEYRF